jgi:hypothetical protein
MMAGVRSLPSRFEPLPPGVAGCLCPQDGRLAGTGLGQCIVAGREGDVITVVQADPAIAVGGELLRDWHLATPDYISLECRGTPDHIGDLIRVEATERRVIYVVTRVKDRENDIWEARWPD